MHALYAWGNFIREVGLDRDPGWLDPALLAGDRSTLNESLTIVDDGPLVIDGPHTIFDVDGERVEGRTLIGRDLTGADWRVVYIRVATDGTRKHARRIMAEVEEAGDIDTEKNPTRNWVGIGKIVTAWEDSHGQWDFALLKVKESKG
ncbi:hypothetical protein [Catenuloplanes japonicus]|uniref:hypothetical protein n=1 Tax=Catenuloplanes japonicus TaxID=33876 RepID=UPI0012F955C2|nr:hypothetical protein [Catenuloplanes japonicus]